MKTYIPTIGLIASLAFACSNSLAQEATTPAPPKVPRGVAVASAPQAEAEAVEASLEAQSDALRAQEEALENVNKSLTLIGGHSGRATSTRSLIIPKDPPDAKNITEAEEDMSVMARILEKAVGSKRQKSERIGSAGNVWVLGGSSATPRNLYIDGFGALFFLNVNYPLLPTATKEETTDSKNESDSEWKRTHDELYSHQGSGSGFNFNFTPFDSGSYYYSTGGPAEEYDEEKVTELKENLTAALKNASHIRRLKGDETVTVIVTGRSPSSATKVTTRKSQNGSSSSSSSSSWSTSSRSGSQAPAARLMIRAKRSDIESFQKDKLNADDFRKKVTAFIY